MKSRPKAAGHWNRCASGVNSSFRPEVAVSATRQITDVLRFTPNRLLAALGACGILSTLSLVVASALGAVMRANYDSVRDSISELYEMGAPHAHWLMVLFTLYHALVISVGLARGLPPAPRGWIGPFLLGLAGVFGIPLGAYARCDPGCFGATTFRGQLHGILVLLTVPLIFAAMIGVWYRLRHYSGWRRYRRYTLTTVIVGIVFGIAMIPFIQGPYTGLLERISVGLIVQWYAVSGALLIAVARNRA